MFREIIHFMHFKPNMMNWRQEQVFFGKFIAGKDLTHFSTAVINLNYVYMYLTDESHFHLRASVHLDIWSPTEGGLGASCGRGERFPEFRGVGFLRHWRENTV